MTVELIREEQTFLNRRNRCDWQGLSGDTKPTTGAIGSTYYETDTGDLYVYAGATWVKKYTLVKLQTGDLNIGNVDVASIAAGETHIGEVSEWSDLIVVTPTIAAAGFTANDFVGGKLTLTNAVRVAAGKGKITGLKIVDAAKQNADLLVFIFKADLAGTYTDNAAESVTADDWLNWIGTIEILSSDWQEMANASLVDLGFEMLVEASAGRNLYVLIVTTGTPTFTENCLQLTFGVGE